MTRNKRWTKEEDELLLRQVRAFPQNLSKCFLIEGQSTNRSQRAVANHWYTSLSKRSDVLCFFTASSKHVSKNRKNGIGVEITRTIWQRFLNVLRNL